MKRRLQRMFSVGTVILGALAAVDCYADHNVTVRATATPEYTQHKFGGGKAAPETYVLKAGRVVDLNAAGRKRRSARATSRKRR